MTDLLEVTAVKRNLRTTWCGQDYRYYEEVGSTNELLKQLAAAGSDLQPAAGTVVLTNYQSQGRGRLDRRWEAAAGSSLLFSILFRPFWPLTKCNWLTMLASVAIVETIGQQTGLDAKIKWPNDIVLKQQGVWCKVAGLLLETNLDDNGRCATAVLGMGINLNIPQEQLPQAVTPAASLLSASGFELPRQPFLLELLTRLEKGYEAAANGRSPQIDWQQNLVTIGQLVSVSNQGSAEALTGTAVGTDAWGQLLLETSDGRLHTIVAGDVTLRH